MEMVFGMDKELTLKMWHFWLGIAAFVGSAVLSIVSAHETFTTHVAVEEIRYTYQQGVNEGLGKRMDKNEDFTKEAYSLASRAMTLLDDDREKRQLKQRNEQH